MLFSATVRAQMEGRVVRCALLTEFRFASQTVRVWEGFGRLRTNDDRFWDGLAGMGSISGLAQSINGSAPPLTLTLSGVDETFAARAKGEASDYYNRAVVVCLQFFDEDFSCLDDPYAIALARMTNLTSKREAGPEGPVYSVSLTAETPFATRRRPKYGWYTDRDQQRRFPGDRGLERMAGIDNKNITFPAF